MKGIVSVGLLASAMLVVSVLPLLAEADEACAQGATKKVTAKVCKPKHVNTGAQQVTNATSNDPAKVTATIDNMKNRGGITVHCQRGSESTDTNVVVTNADGTQIIINVRCR